MALGISIYRSGMVDLVSGVRICWHLQLSWVPGIGCFHTRDLQQYILPEFIRSSPDEAITRAEAAWTSLSSGSKNPAIESQHIQRAWDKPVSEHYKTMLRSQATTDIDRARLMAASSPHSDDWLAAPHTQSGNGPQTWLQSV